MTLRPSDLPDFGSPPVTEVILGVQFDNLDRLAAPYLGLIWEAFRDRLPVIEEHHPLDPAFEIFANGGPPMLIPQLQFAVLDTPPLARIFFINTDRTQLLQVQRDRFIHNWRKVGDNDTYPRFEQMLKTFEEGYLTFSKLIEKNKIGIVVPNQCEISYINHIVVPPDTPSFNVFSHLFGGFSDAISLDELGAPEDTRLLLRYIIRDNSNSPAGRLFVVGLPARRQQDGANIIQLTLTARGKPTTADLSGIRNFLSEGRRHIVRSFTRLTSEEMHKAWKRQQ